MFTLEHLLQKFSISFDERKRMPIEIPNFGRDGLAALFNELGFKLGAEIGTLNGTYAETLCKLNPGLKLFCIDPYLPYRGYKDFTHHSTFDKAMQNAQTLLKPYDATFIRKFSMDAVKDFEDNSLDFVYIDGNHDFQNATNDIIEWQKKIKVGGIIAGHDYAKHKGGHSHIHVAEAVNGITEAYKIRPWFILGTNAIIPGEVRDPSRSWMWIKQ